MSRSLHICVISSMLLALFAPSVMAKSPTTTVIVCGKAKIAKHITAKIVLQKNNRACDRLMAMGITTLRNSLPGKGIVVLRENGAVLGDKHLLSQKRVVLAANNPRASRRFSNTPPPPPPPQDPVNEKEKRRREKAKGKKANDDTILAQQLKRF